MRPSRIVPCLVLVALLAGCENDPEGPATDQLASPQFGATHMEWDSPQPPRGEHFIPCANDGAGENLDFEGAWWAHWTLIATPSDDQIMKVKIVYSDDFKATGAEDVWMIDAHASGGNSTIVLGAGEVFHFNVNEFYTNQDGDKLHIQFVAQIVVENMQLKLYLDNGWCPGQG